MLRLLFAIPHYCRPDAQGRYGSMRTDLRSRVRGLERCIAALHQSFGARHETLAHGARKIVPTEAVQAATVDVLVCTTRDAHGIDQIELPPESYRHRPCACEPMELEFECQAALRDGLGRYDYYGFLEDDMIVRDPWFFAKLAWFDQLAGRDAVLQACRYELSEGAPPRKLYIDGEIRAEVSEPFQDVTDRPEIRADFLGREIVFRRPHNPHAASFFLTAEQLEHWVKQPWFGDRDTSFVGPLESAATLGIMRTFRLYKPAPRFAAFFEIQHLGQAYIDASSHFDRRKPWHRRLRSAWRAVRAPRR